jgi:hypothetical protein
MLVVRLKYMLVMALLTGGCSVEPNEGSLADESSFSDGDIAVRDTTIASSDASQASGSSQTALSLSLFKEHVYPVLKKNCATCHGTTTAPLFAQDDDVAAFQALSNAKKINFENTIQSRLVLRMSQDLHNCWGDCSENATIMKSAIDNWKAGLESGSAGTGKGFPFKSAELNLTQVRTIKTANPTSPGIIVFEAESTTLKAPFIVTANGVASSGKIISTSTGGAAPAGLAGTVPDLSSLGSFTIDFEVDEDGFYQVFAKVIAPSNNENTVYYRLNDEAAKTWTMGTTATLDWRQMSQDEAPAGAIKFELTKGAHKLTIFQAEDRILFDKFVITNRTLGAFDSYEVSPLNNAALIFNLKPLINLDVSFAIAVEKLDEATYLLRAPVLLNNSGKNISIKGIYPLLNGVWSEQNATFSKVKGLSTSLVTPLSTAATTVIADKGFTVDKLSIGIEELKIVD